LVGAGIVARVSNEALQGIVGSVPAGLSTDPRVLVDEKDAPRAREIALEFECKLRPAKAKTDPSRAWHQFTIRALMFVTACVAVYLGVERAIAPSGAQVN
jgi:Putative prokaryotic signal transducing protein